MKLAAGLGGVALIAAAVGGFGLWTASTIDDGYAALIAGEVAVASAGEELDTAVEATLAAELAFVLDHDELGVEASAGALEHAREEQEAMDAALVAFVDVAAGTEFEGQAAALADSVERYDADFETLVTAMSELGARETGAVGAFVSVLGLLEEDLSGSADVERLLRFAEQFLASPTAEHAEVFLTQLATVPETEHTADVAGRVPTLVEGFSAEHQALEESAAIAAEIDATIAGIVENVEADEHAAVEAMHARSDRAKLVLAGLILVGLVIAAAVAAVMSRSFSSAARTMSALADAVVGEDIAALLGVAEAAAQGDLTARFDVTERLIDTSRGDELGDIARSFQAIVASLGRFGEAFNRMLTDLADTVGGIKEVAFNVSAGSHTTATGSEETARGATEIAASITEVANAVTSQATQSELMLAAVEDIETGLRATIEALGDASDASDAARQGGADGRLTLEATTAAMERINQAIGVAARHIEAMGRSSQQVEEMVDVIRSIAEQTNLLALNAAIEAARAGEMGRGFAVVASEVKALAEESAKSSERVASVVGEMRQSVDLAVTSMNDGLESVAEGGERIGGVTAAFGVIDTTIQEIGSRVETLGGLGQQIAGAAERIRVEAESMAATAESNSAATEQVAAASEESAAISEELGATSEELAAASEELTRLVARFRTD